MKKRKFSGGQLALFSMTLPAIIKLIIFSYLPMFGIILAFKDLNYRDGILGSPWVGLKNFEFFFKSEAAWRVTRNTIGMNAIFIVSVTTVSVLFAVCLYKIQTKKTCLKIYQSAMFFPYFLSWVVVAFLLNTVIGDSGVITHLLQSVGYDPKFMITPNWWPLILTVINIWKGAGYNSIVYYAVLLSVDESLYEAAELDGASGWNVFAKIQLPHMTPMIVLNVLMAIGAIFRADFGMFYFLPGSQNTFTLATTEVIDTYAFRALQDQGNMSMSAAVGVYQSIVGFLLILLANYVVKRYDSTMSLF